MRSPFSFDGDLARAPYAALAGAVFFSQHVIVWAVIALSGQPPPMHAWFAINPLRALVDNGGLGHQQLAAPVVLAGMALLIVVAWLLTALSFRRARQASVTLMWPLLAIIPILQLPLILTLSLATPRAQEATEAPTAHAGVRPRAVALGVFLGATIAVAAVAFSTLVLRTYGYSLFIATPFIVGAVTAYIARREAATDIGDSIGWALVALSLCAGALIAFAIEGVICLVFAAPLIGALGALGALLGHAIARSQRPRSTMMASVALLPVLMMGEAALPPRLTFESVESVDIAAAPELVWNSITHMEPIPAPPSAPFRWGLAYPIAGRLNGTGVGAVRRGVFSTGVAYERVTEWAPNEKLTFIVLSDPPMMHELSPYEHVHAPHLAGYFRTQDARFTLTPLANGRTRLTLATAHDLDLEPALYWLPFARWAVHTNKARVLDHFRQQAERAAAL